MSCDPAWLTLPEGEWLAFRASPGTGPGVVFCGGFTSDMEGTKACALEDHCRDRGAAFVRFDYRGHGRSSGRFEDGTIGGWTADALAVIDRCTAGPLVLVGSSMGGWIMTLAALARPSRVAGLVGIAAAPDFTADLLVPRLGEAGRRALATGGGVVVPNPYGDAPTRLGATFFADAERHRVLPGPLPLTCPARLLHGLADQEVPWQQSVRLAEALGGETTVTLVKGGDHRLSDPPHLARLFGAVDELRRLVDKAPPGGHPRPATEGGRP